MSSAPDIALAERPAPAPASAPARPAEAALPSAPASAPRPAGRRAGSPPWIGLVLPAAILALWQTATSLHWVKPYFLPSPESVATTFWAMLTTQALLHDFRVSITIILEGFVLGTLAGLAAGFVAGLSKTAERFLAPTLNAIRQVPPLAWIPLLVLWLGAGSLGKAVLIAKAVFFPVFLNTVQGIRGVSKDHIEVGRVFGYGRLLMVRRIILPSALPTIFVGIRYAAGLAWAVMIAAEMIGSRYGLGYLLMRAQELLLTSQLFVVIILIGAVGYGLDAGLRRVETRLLSWRKGFEG